MTTTLWIAQGLLAFVFLMAGMMKLMQPKAKLLDMMGVLEPIPPLAIKGIALAEVLGAIGVILPSILETGEGWVPLAAAGLALTMIGAMIAHGRRGEWPFVGVNAVLFALAAYVAWTHWNMVCCAAPATP